MLAVDCGIDIGSTNLKIVLVDEEGKLLLTRSVPSPRAHDGMGAVTNPIELVSALEALIVDGHRELALNRPLRSIAAAGVGEDGCGVTKELLPTGHSIPWFDGRASAEADFLRQYACVERTGIAIDATRTAAKWLWLHRHRPQELAASAFWIALTDFPAAWWAGKAFTSESLAPRTACFDVHKRQWIDELLALSGSPGLPDVVAAGTIIGTVRSGPLRDHGAASAETLLVAGGHDHPMAASVIRRTDNAGLVDSMGTANLLYGETAKFTDPNLARSIAFSLPPAGPGFACLGVLELGRALHKFARRGELKGFLSRARLPGSPPKSLQELQHHAGSSDAALRRVLESYSLQARRLLAVMDEAGVPAGAIYATGGWSRSAALVELRASVFGRPVCAVGNIELAALGAAQFGAEAAGARPGYRFDSKNSAVIEPCSSWADSYNELFAVL